MLLLPRLLYFSVVLPVTPKKVFFKELHAILTELIWGSHRRRVALNIIQRGPQTELYYAAAQVQWPMRWLGLAPNTERVDLMSIRRVLHY